MGSKRVRVEFGQQHLGQATDAGFVFRIADIDDSPVTAAVFVLYDPVETLYAVGNTRFLIEAALSSQ